MRRYGVPALMAGLLLILAACSSPVSKTVPSMMPHGFARCIAIHVPLSGGWLTGAGAPVHVRAVRACYPGANGAYYQGPGKVMMYTELETLFVKSWDGPGKIIPVLPGMHYLITGKK